MFNLESSNARKAGKIALKTKEEMATNFQFYLNLAKQGNAEAQNRVGYYYNKGEGVDKDAKQAIEWYHKAAAQGYPSAQYNLGCHYELLAMIGQIPSLSIEDIQRNAELAFKWHQQAAEQGHAPGQRALGNCYQHGIGVIGNNLEAVSWYRKAADQGDEPAIKRIAELVQKDPRVLADEITTLRKTVIEMEKRVQFLEKKQKQSADQSQKSISFWQPATVKTHIVESVSISDKRIERISKL